MSATAEKTRPSGTLFDRQREIFGILKTNTTHKREVRDGELYQNVSVCNNNLAESWHPRKLTWFDFAENWKMPELTDLLKFKKIPEEDWYTSSVGNRWKPNHFGDVVRSFHKVANRCGYKVVSEEFSLTPDKQQVAMMFELEPMYGSMTAHPKAKMRAGSGLIFGLLLDNFQRIALTGVAGEKVFLCNNGCVNGTFVLKAKQTTNMDVEDVLRRGFQAWEAQQAELERKIEMWKATPLDRSDTAAIMAEATCVTEDNLEDTPLITSAFSRRILGEFIEPRHEEFQERTAYNLYQATTEMLKHESRGSMNNLKAIKLMTEMGNILYRHGAAKRIDPSLN
jgi:hypothetical protein